MVSLQSWVERARILTGRDASGLGPRAGGVVTLVRENCDQLFYTYAGGKGGLMLDPRKFFHKTRMFERNVAFLRDDRCVYYQRGVASLDSFEALLEWQVQLRDRLPHVRRLYCLGTSMGAYAAILFGYLLKVEQVWAFGPTDSRLPKALVRALDLPPQRADLEHLLSRPNGITRYHVHYNESCLPDALAARRIATCEGVTLHPQSGEGHNVVNTLLEGGLLDNLLPDPGRA